MRLTTRFPLSADVFAWARQRTTTKRRTRAALALLRGEAPCRGAALLLLDDHRLDGRVHALVDLDDDHVRADVADRLLELDLAAVDSDSAGLADRVGDVLRGDRAEQTAVLAGLLLDRQDGAAEQRSVLLRAVLRVSGGLVSGDLARLSGLERASGGRLRQLAGDQEVAQVPRGDVDDRALSPSCSTSWRRIAWGIVNAPRGRCGHGGRRRAQEHPRRHTAEGPSHARA